MRDEFLRSIRLKKANPKIIERFLSKFEELEDDECWLWMGGGRHSYASRILGAPRVFGAGRFYFRRRPSISVSASRIQWELCVGPLDRYSLVTLDCGNKHCMNFMHMRVRCRGFNYTALEAIRVGQRWRANE